MARRPPQNFPHRRSGLRSCRLLRHLSSPFSSLQRVVGLTPSVRTWVVHAAPSRSAPRSGRSGHHASRPPRRRCPTPRHQPASAVVPVAGRADDGDDRDQDDAHHGGLLCSLAYDRAGIDGDSRSLPSPPQRSRPTHNRLKRESSGRPRRCRRCRRRSARRRSERRQRSAFPFTVVPFVEPRSRRCTPSAACSNSACQRLTLLSASRIAASG